MAKKLSTTTTASALALPSAADNYLDPLLWLTPLTPEGLNPFGGSSTSRTTITFSFLGLGTYALYDPESTVDVLNATTWNTGLAYTKQTAGNIAGQAVTLSGEQAAVYSALLAWSSVANVDLRFSTPAFDSTGQSTTDFTFLATNEAGMRNFWSGEKGVLGFSELPYNYGPNYDVHDANYSEGYAVFNQGGFGWTAAGLKPGGYGYVTLVHEIGHLFGLDHPWNEGGFYVDGQGNHLAPEPFFPGANTSNQTGDFGLNQGIFTTMTYNDGWNGQPSKSADWGYQKGPGAFDIAAIQELYGVNTQTHAGSTTYKLPTANVSGTGWETIWDGDADHISPNVEDTIRVPEGAGGSATIDLRAATLDTSDGQGAGGYVSWISGIAGGFTIAHGVVIENAIGGAGNDKIIGNAYANEITGGGGQDTMTGSGGADTFIFLKLSDTVSGNKHDVITDFGHDDVIDLSQVDISTSRGLQTFHWEAAGQQAAFTGTPGDLHFINGILAGDVNGDKRADFEIALTGVTSLDADDVFFGNLFA